jgi:hypothetical protein
MEWGLEGVGVGGGKVEIDPSGLKKEVGRSRGGYPSGGFPEIKAAFATLILFGHGDFWQMVARVSRLPVRGNTETWKAGSQPYCRGSVLLELFASGTTSLPW